MTIDQRLIADGGLFTEVDPNSRLSSTGATNGTFTGIANNETAYRYIDYTAGYFQKQFVAKGKFNFSATGTGRLCFSFSNGLSHFNDVTSAVGAQIYGNTTNLSFVVTERNASTNYNSTANLVISQSTLHYYQFGRYSSLGAKGGLVLQVFSDSTLETLLSWALKVITQTDNNYQYYHDIQTNNFADSGTATGIHDNITLSVPAAGIDLTTGVETDTGTGRLVVYADCIVATALNIANSETAKHVAIDEGADFFGDYTVSGVLNITAFVSTVVSKRFNILSVTDAAADALLANDLQGISIEDAGASTYKPYIHQAASGTDTFSTAGPTLNLNQPYSFTLNRSGTTLTMKVWNDLVLTNFAGTSQVGSDVTWTGRATTTYRYLMPVASTLNGVTSRSSTFTLGGVKVQGGPPTTGYGSSASILRAIQAATFTKEFSFTSASAVFPISATTYAKVGVSDVVTLLRVLSQTEGVNPNVIRTYARLMLTSSSAYTRSGGAGSAAMEGKSVTAITATKTSAGATIGQISSKVTITTVGYSGIFLKLISVRFTKPNANTGIQEPVSGLTPTLKVKRGTDGKSLDFDDDLFKATGWIDIDANLVETDPTNYPGTYDYFLQVNGFGDGADTVYQLFVQDTTLGYYADGTIILRDGVEQWGGMNSAQNLTLTTLPTAAENAIAVLAAATTTPIAANIKQVNEVTIQGAGISGNSMRPV